MTFRAATTALGCLVLALAVCSGLSAQSTTPSDQTAAPSGQTAAPSGQTAAPSGQTAAPSGQTAAPSGQTAAPSGQTAAPSDLTPPAPSGPTAAPSDQNTAPAPSQGTESGAQWYIDKPIKAFTFKGLVTIKESDLQAVLRQYIGQRFSIDPLLMDMQAKLYALDYFESIEPNALPGDDARSSLIIQFIVKERPTITQVQIKGNTSVRTGDITDKILLKKGDLANQGRLQADIEAVKSLYLDKGYTDATVSAAFVPAETAGTVQRRLHDLRGHSHDDQGDQLRRQHVCLRQHAPRRHEDQGAVPVRQRRVPGVEAGGGQDRHHRLLHGPRVRGRQDRQDHADRAGQAGRNYLVLTVYLTEGDQWKYGGMTITGQYRVLHCPAGRICWYQKPGKMLSLQKVDADMNRIRLAVLRQRLHLQRVHHERDP